MSVAFTKEDSAETASETLLPDRPVSPHPNLVTEAGLKALEFQLQQAREAYEAAQKIDDVNERRRQAATPLRDARYFSARVRTAQVIPSPASNDTVAFGKIFNVTPDLFNDAHEFVAQNEVFHLRKETVVNMQIRTADSGRSDTQDNIARIFDFGIGNVVNFDVPRSMKNKCLHSLVAAWASNSCGCRLRSSGSTSW